MFIVAMSTIVKLWKEPRCPSTDEWIKKMCVCIYTHTHTHWNIMQPSQSEILPFATMWMELEGIMLSKISQLEKENYHMISLICGS